MPRPAFTLAAAAAAAATAALAATLAAPAWAQQQPQPPQQQPQQRQAPARPLQPAEASAPQPFLTTQAVNAYRRCYGRTLWDDPALAPVLARIQPKGQPASAPVEYSTDRISDQEKPALLAWLAGMQKCQQVSDAALSDAPAPAKAAVREWQAATTQAIRNAYETRPTWAALVASMIASSQALDARIQALLQAQDALQKRENEEAGAAAVPSSAALIAFNQCTAAMWANPAIAPVAARISVNTREAAAQLRRSTDKASEQEKPAIAFWLEELQRCQKAADASQVNAPNLARPIILSWQADTRRAVQDLYAGTLTWGELAQALTDRSATLKDQFDALIRQQNAELRRQAGATAPKAVQ